GMVRSLQGRREDSRGRRRGAGGSSAAVDHHADRCGRGSCPVACGRGGVSMRWRGGDSFAKLVPRSLVMMILIQPPRRETGVRPGAARRRWLVLAAGLALATAGQAGAAEEVVLRLKWWHQFQFAGYYAAQAKGYYEEEGLAVRIDQGRAGSPSGAAVLAGEAQFGVSDSDVVRAYLNGDPVVVCAAIFQHSPYVIMSRRDRGISKPSDLVGARVMLSDEQGAAQLKGMMVREGIDPERAVIVPHSWRLDDLIEGRVDAISAYATVEPALMRAAGVEPHLLRSSDYGVDFYGDVLFTSREQAARH